MKHRTISRRTGRRQRGQILVIILLGTAVLASLIFYVINVGDTINTKVAMQNAADSTAIAGAAWMAKSFNIIAMNNVAQSRMIAIVPVVDALPLSTRMAYTEIKAWEERLGLLRTLTAAESLVSIYRKSTSILESR